MKAEVRPVEGSTMYVMVSALQTAVVPVAVDMINMQLAVAGVVAIPVADKTTWYPLMCVAAQVELVGIL